MSNVGEETIGKTSNQSEERTSQDETCDTYFFYRSSIIKFMSNSDTLLVLMKSTVGTGLFTMPYAFSRVGIVFGVILLIGMGFFITKCLQFFLKIHRTTCTRLGKSAVMYDEIVEATLKTMDTRIPKIFIDLATYFTNSLLVFYYIGVSSVCVDFIADVIREILKFEETDNPARYTSLFFPFFMMLNLSKHLRDMTLKSMAGNILILNVIIISFAYAFESNTTETWTVLNNDYLMYPRFIGIIFYSLSSPGLILAIKHNMNNPESDTKFSKLLDQGMILIILLHLLVGIVGYLKWGSNVSENFLLDVQHNANGYTLLALIMQALAIYLTYGLQCFVAISIFLKQYATPAIEYGTCKGTLYLWELIVRFAVTLVSCKRFFPLTFSTLSLRYTFQGGLPIFIPKLRSRIALLGLTCNVILTFLLPFTLHMLLFIEDLDETARRNWKVVTGILCIVFTSIFALCCFFIDLSLIFKHY